MGIIMAVPEIRILVLVAIRVAVGGRLTLTGQRVVNVRDVLINLIVTT